MLYSCPTDSESNGEGADGHHKEESEEEVDGTHRDGEGTDDEITVSHTDDAELLLEETDKKP